MPCHKFWIPRSNSVKCQKCQQHGSTGTAVNSQIILIGKNQKSKIWRTSNSTTPKSCVGVGLDGSWKPGKKQQILRDRNCPRSFYMIVWPITKGVDFLRKRTIVCCTNLNCLASSSFLKCWGPGTCSCRWGPRTCWRCWGPGTWLNHC